MSRKILYEIGAVRIWKENSWTYFELVDNHRRLDRCVNTLKEVPSILSVLIEQLLSELDEYLKILYKRLKELDSWYHELEQKIEEYKMKGWRPMCEGVKKKQQKTVEKIKEVEEMIQFVSDFKGSLERILNDLNRLIEIVEKARKEVIV